MYSLSLTYWKHSGQFVIYNNFFKNRTTNAWLIFKLPLFNKDYWMMLKEYKVFNDIACPASRNLNFFRLTNYIAYNTYRCFFLLSVLIPYFKQYTHFKSYAYSFLSKKNYYIHSLNNY